MGRTVVLYNGVDLTADYVVSDLRRPLLPKEAMGATVPGMDGEVYTGSRLTPRMVTLTMYAIDADIALREAAARRLAAALDVQQPAPLSISIDGGLYLMAVPTSTGDAARFTQANSFQVQFKAFDPVFWGEQRTVTVPSGGSVTFDVDGTYPAEPVISAPAAANGSGGFWRVRLEDGSYLLATIPSGLSTAPVVADCAARTLKVNSINRMLVPAADWLVLTPGTHTLDMTGTGAATVTYRERWL